LGEFPALGGHHDGVAFAVNQEYVREAFRPGNDDEVAFITAGERWRRCAESVVGRPVSIGRDPVDIEALEGAVADPSAGATVTFAGTTRNGNAGAASAKARVRGLRTDGAERNAQVGARGGRTLQNRAHRHAASDWHGRDRRDIGR